MNRSEAMVHRIQEKTPLQQGDVVKLDFNSTTMRKQAVRKGTPLVVVSVDDKIRQGHGLGIVLALAAEDVEPGDMVQLAFNDWSEFKYKKVR